MKIYMNRECGNIHLTKAAMLEEAAELYDIGDPTNDLSWEEYYDVVEEEN